MTNPPTPAVMPDLPEPIGYLGGVLEDEWNELPKVVNKLPLYTGDQIHNYAAPIQAELEAARAEIERLREALQELSDTEQFDDDHPQLEAARKKAFSALTQTPGAEQ